MWKVLDSTELFPKSATQNYIIITKLHIFFTDIMHVTSGISNVGVDLQSIYASIIMNVDLLCANIWASGGPKGRNTIKKHMCPWSSEMF